LSSSVPAGGHRLHSVIGCVTLIGVGLVLSSVVVATGPEPLRLTACFSHVGGLEAGDEVTLNGVVVGQVKRLELDADQRPCAELLLSGGLELDDDTSAAIFTKNVLGEKYVAIDPGGGERRLVSGDQIHYTQSALPIERIMIRLLEHQLGATIE